MHPPVIRAVKLALCPVVPEVGDTTSSSSFTIDSTCVIYTGVTDVALSILHTV